MLIGRRWWFDKYSSCTRQVPETNCSACLSVWCFGSLGFVPGSQFTVTLILDFGLAPTAKDPPLSFVSAVASLSLTFNLMECEFGYSLATIKSQGKELATTAQARNACDTIGSILCHERIDVCACFDSVLSVRLYSLDGEDNQSTSTSEGESGVHVLPRSTCTS